MAEKMSRTEMKRIAQDELLHGIGNIIGYWRENPPDELYEPDEERDAEYAKILQREADRVARMFGYEAAWSN